VLKNPYNTVRAPWLRAALPDARIVAVVRRPLPNVFSLAKKHAENPHVHRAPEGGWWGVKPAGWRELLDDDRVLQSARQWDRVNRKLLDDQGLVDRIVTYQDLCADPERIVGEIAAGAVGRVPDVEFPALSAQDDEYVTGGPLESANKVFKRTGHLDLEGAERAEERLEAFTEAQREMVLEVCGETAGRLGLGE
jgi:hypothetical protein